MPETWREMAERITWEQLSKWLTDRGWHLSIMGTKLLHPTATWASVLVEDVPAPFELWALFAKMAQLYRMDECALVREILGEPDPRDVAMEYLLGLAGISWTEHTDTDGHWWVFLVRDGSEYEATGPTKAAAIEALRAQVEGLAPDTDTNDMPLEVAEPPIEGLHEIQGPEPDDEALGEKERTPRG